MKKNTTVEAFIENFPEWKSQLQTLRALILQNTAVKETIKWGAPVYTVNGKNVIGLGAFKSYAGLWFFQGALLSDQANVLINAQEGKTQALRQWRFSAEETIPQKLVTDYINRAVQNQLENKTVLLTKKKPLPIPNELTSAFEADKILEQKFKELPNYKQKEYIEYIATAKRVATKHNRLEKIIPMIMEGKGLSDQYR
ncbi:YdeI/OmpD-associated family protein [Kordia zhangzhouensis]|uniref:YdeI/OmpD-associated family protein n=1 Tax=Kordia zhangzhouensis TaxID=1620405 RepID=UPI000629071F|nr:DUF1801 domain-containing protein [Kordia zhangzhouensis]